MNTITIILISLALISIIFGIGLMVRNRTKTRKVREEVKPLPPLPLDMPQLFKDLKPAAPEILLDRDIQCMLQTISKVENYSYHNQTEINNKLIQITVKVETFKGVD